MLPLLRPHSQVLSRVSTPIPGLCIQPCRPPSAAQAHGACSNVARKVLHRHTIHSAVLFAKCCAGCRWPSAAQAHGARSNVACQVLHRRAVHSAMAPACAAKVHGAFSNTACQVLHRRTVHSAMSLKCCAGAVCIQKCRLPSAAPAYGACSNAACQVLHRRTALLVKCCTGAWCIQQCCLPSTAQAQGASSNVACQVLQSRTVHSAMSLAKCRARTHCDIPCDQPHLKRLSQRASTADGACRIAFRWALFQGLLVTAAVRPRGVMKSAVLSFC